MRNNPPKRGEQMTVDLERWQLEMAEELGILEEAHGNAYATLTPRPVLRSIHGAKKSRKP
ncbi:MAG TPA: hypothetical protein DDZ53_02270 [Firmicutes bacterium]|nr:hypothetical protein [Bacillota bacterium]